MWRCFSQVQICWHSTVFLPLKRALQSSSKAIFQRIQCCFFVDLQPPVSCRLISSVQFGAGCQTSRVLDLLLSPRAPLAAPPQSWIRTKDLRVFAVRAQRLCSVKSWDFSKICVVLFTSLLLWHFCCWDYMKFNCAILSSSLVKHLANTSKQMHFIILMSANVYLVYTLLVF